MPADNFSGPQAGVVIYHNPECGTSRNALALIQHYGIPFDVVAYLKTPPTRSELADIIARAGLSVRAVLREKGTPYSDLGLANPGLSDDDLLNAMMAHPILINRPLVMSPKGVALCRPSDVVADLLPDLPVPNLLKAEGVPFLRSRPVPAEDPDFTNALIAEGLPVDDLSESGRTFSAFSTLDGVTVGYGGLELIGEDVLLRSVVVLPAFRGKNLGRNIVPLLLYRAYREGARHAWLLTNTAAPFFEALGFKVTDRRSAPADVLATRQAAILCPASASLLSRKIGF
jgi:arsenate reductase